MDSTANTKEHDITSLIQSLIERFDRLSLNNDLWDAADIANYMRLGKKTVQNHIVSNDGFPRPVILVTGGKRWVPSEVKAWVLRRR